MQSSITAIINYTLPELRLLDARSLGAHGHVLTMSDGRRVVVRVGDVAAEVAALRLLAGEIDLPVPELIAADLEGRVGGQPWLLRSFLEGAPVSTILDQLDEEVRHRIGQRLGDIMMRVHNLACERYGVLAGSDPYGATRDDLAYIRLRAEAAIMAAEVRGALAAPLAADLRHWFAREYSATGRTAALVHGDLRPDCILVRLSGGRDDGGVGARISGLVGWHTAFGWSPGWDHVSLLDQTDASAFFGVRVGYGERYDEANPRAAEQVREYALQPYRLVRYLERLAASDDEQRALYQRHLAAQMRLRGRMT